MFKLTTTCTAYTIIHAAKTFIQTFQAPHQYVPIHKLKTKNQSALTELLELSKSKSAKTIRFHNPLDAHN